MLGFAQCKRSSTNTPNFWLGHYEIRGYDNIGQAVFTGTIVLLSIEQNHLKGQCTINPEKLAPDAVFDQNSVCEGTVDGKKVSMDLAPYLDDAGLLLEGQLEDGRILGVWRLDGFVTSEVLGKFEALKKNSN
jgi:hypothetical protein